MINFKKYSYLAFIIFLAYFTTLLFNFNRVEASAVDALKEAPAGININEYFANKPTGPVQYFTHNGAKIVTGNNSVLDLASGPHVSTDSDDVGAGYGSYWSNPDKQNYIDLTDNDPNRPQTISAWLYFGNGNAEKNGAGMAFVIQNDVHKTGALGAGGEGLGVYGADKGTVATHSLGGDPSYAYLTTDPEDIANTAIQKSVAIEFDSQRSDASRTTDDGTTASPLHVDVSKTKEYFPLIQTVTTKTDVLNGFDTANSTTETPVNFPDRYRSNFGGGGAFGHIAFTYPSDPRSYALVPNPLGNINKLFPDQLFGNVYSLLHIHTTTAAPLVDDKDTNNDPVYWHHITIKWTPTGDGENAVLSYAFNDVNPNNLTENYAQGQSNFNRVEDATTVNYKETFGTDATQALWGFTGANNGSTDVDDKLVDFESIPALLYIESSSSITDNTERKNIENSRDNKGNDLNSDTQKTVGNGDDLTLNYNLDYQSGRTNWKGVSDTEGIKATINLPKYFDTVKDVDGNIGTAIFKDADGNQIGSENIPASESNGTVITHSLDHAIQVGTFDSNKISSISFAINGTADNPDTADKTSAPAAATFTGSNNITNTSTPEFIVKGKQTYTLAADTPTSINLPYKGTTGLVLPVSLHYTGHTFSGDDPIYYTITVNNKKYTSATTISSTTADATDKNINLQDLIGDNDKFWNIFTNDDTVKKVYVTASDVNGVTSNKAEYDIHVIPDKTLELTPEDLEFGSTQGLSPKKVMSRKEGFDLRIKSSNTPWYLYGTGTTLKDSNNHTFNGNLIYKKDDNTSSENLQNNLIFIDQHTDKTSCNVDIPEKDDWQNDTGVLLNNDGHNFEGDYQGEITWTLEDTPQKL